MLSSSPRHRPCSPQICPVVCQLNSLPALFLSLTPSPSLSFLLLFIPPTLPLPTYNHCPSNISLCADPILLPLPALSPRAKVAPARHSSPAVSRLYTRRSIASCSPFSLESNCGIAQDDRRSLEHLSPTPRRMLVLPRCPSATIASPTLRAERLTA